MSDWRVSGVSQFKCVATLVPPAALTVEHFRELE